MHFNTIDPKRYLALKSHGLSRLMLWVQSCIEDVRGFVEIDDIDAAVLRSRITCMKCISIFSLATNEGEIDEPHENNQINFDPFSGVSIELVSKWMAHCVRAYQIDWETEKWIWFDELKGFVKDTELILGLQDPVPILRSPEGLSGILFLANTLDRAAQDAGLPTSLPREWQIKK